MTLRDVSGALLVMAASTLAGCPQPVELSWKSATFSGANRGRALEVSRDVVVRHSLGTTIRADAATGRIETDPIEEAIGGKTLRQQRYVDVREKGGAVEVAVFAPMFQLELDPGASPAVRWLPIGSDVQVEAALLDEIIGRVLALEPDARVLGTTLPRAARPR